MRTDGVDGSPTTSHGAVKVMDLLAGISSAKTKCELEKRSWR